ncbi:hypothetical protein A9F13_03g03520 [Clavispora lusitaniae]|uniref:Uncharacterized protein n=1 Tax=Clavispora lusitaniae TaxID=36911 RepID=A0AA91Q340_CLALS|nr:hypothetical protein A9F13_03g03520 [Clavispora lusitaniae]
MSTLKLEKQDFAPDSRSFPRKIWDFYYHHFPFYMLTNIEKIWLHAFLVTFVTFFVFAIYNLPKYFSFVFSRAYYYLTGTDVDL